MYELRQLVVDNREQHIPAHRSQGAGGKGNSHVSHFFAPDGSPDKFDNIGWYAPNSVSRAWINIGTSFDVALWGGTDLDVDALPQHRDAPPGGENVVWGISLSEASPRWGTFASVCCTGLRTGTFRIQTSTRKFFSSNSVWMDVVVTTAEFGRFFALRAAWVVYRASVTPVWAQYDQLRQDLYQVRNAGWNGNPPITFWPASLIDADDGMMAAIEHYFLCRAWVGNGVFNATQMRAQNTLYDDGKRLHLTPQHNPNKPTTKLYRIADLRSGGRRHGR